MVTATLELAEEGGLAAVSVAAVARRAKVSNGAIFHRFASLDELLQATQDSFLTAIELEVTQAIEAAAAQVDDTAAVEKVVTCLLETFNRHQGAFRAFMIESYGHPGLRRRGARCSRACEVAMVRSFSGRFPATQDAVRAAFHIVFAASFTQAAFPDEFVLTAPLNRDLWRQGLYAAVHSLLAPKDISAFRPS